MHYAFGIEFHELSQHHQSAAFHGQATLCRWPLLHSRLLRFSKQSRFWQPHWFIPNLPIFQRRAGGRMALVTCIQFGRKTLAVYNLHLESRGKDELRNCQIPELLADVDQYWDGMPVVIAGDFNFDVTDSFVWPSLNGSAIRNPFNRAGTTAPHSSARNGALDCILIKGPLMADSAKVYNTVCASDHFPLSVTLKLRQRQAAAALCPHLDTALGWAVVFRLSSRSLTNCQQLPSRADGSQIAINRV